MSVETCRAIKDNDIKFVDIMFGDMFGTLMHFTIPSNRVDEDLFEDGLAFDGSSIRSWKSIDKSDMYIKPDPSSAFIDPFREIPTLCMFGDIYEPRTGQLCDALPVASPPRLSTTSAASGLGDMVFFGPEPEFFVFDGVRYGTTSEHNFYEIDSIEAWWTSWP